jgi:hypothetical protein
MLEAIMSHMDVWDWTLLVVGAYIAIACLVRLMRRRRDFFLQEISAQVELEKKRKAMHRRQQERRKFQQERERAT